MKKHFSILSKNKQPARQVDAIKHEIKKYIARERRKDLPESFDYWDFKCLMGVAETSVEEVHLSKINSRIDELVEKGNKEFYLSLSAIPCKRQAKKSRVT